MVRSPFGVAVSEPQLAEAAFGALERSGTAVDACIAAFLSASAQWPSVVLGAATVLTAGPGIGARCFDGAWIQPGKGAPRPRGAKDTDVIPEAATICVSAAIVALYAAHAHDGGLSLAELASPAVKAATAAGLRGRAPLLKRIGASGPLAMREAGFIQEYLEVAGRAVGGSVTDTDLRDSAAEVTPPSTTPRLLLCPSESRPATRVPLDSFVVGACDSRGSIAVMHVVHDPGGPDVPTYDIKAPRAAVPVRRGVPRVTPGARIGLSAPIAIITDETGVVWCGVAFDTASAMSLDELDVGRQEGVTIDQVMRRMLVGGERRARGACAVVRSSVPGGTIRTVMLKAD